MNADLDPTLLAELRDLHQSERAPAELERSVLERLLRSQSQAPFGARMRAWWSRAPFGWSVLGATLSMAALGAIYVGGQAPSMQPSRVLGPEPRFGSGCPLDDLLPGFAYEPTRMEPEAARAGLQLDTFTMPIPGCPPLVRRTLSYVPSWVVGGPVVLVLHDGGDSAEGVRALQAQGSFEALAERAGVIVVYANAAPRAGRFPNSGVWQTDPGANRAIDDFAYLARIVERLEARGLLHQPLGAGPDVYLVGYGSGAHLALEAAAQYPERYVGVAALLPDRLNRSRPPPRRADTRLARVFFLTLEDESRGKYSPGAPLDWAVLNEWQVALGLPAQPPVTPVDQGQAPVPAMDEASLVARRLVPAGTRVFDSWFPDKGVPGVRVMVVQSKAAIDVGPGGSPAPVDAAAVVWEFFERGVPGFDRDRPGYPGAARP
jgi:pimeloyl-ACP methyl ester carboxylesterase